MKNELRYYIEHTLELLNNNEEFVPSYLVLATKLPSGAIELSTNTSAFKEKLEYLLEAYDDDMHLISNSEVQLVQLMLV